MKEKGYSMLEVMLAFAIFSIALLPLLSSYAAIFRMDRIADEREESSRLAISVADYIRAKGYENLNDQTLSNGVKFDLDYGFDEEFEYDGDDWRVDGSGDTFDEVFNLGTGGPWFVINSKALKFGGTDGATIRVQLDKVPVKLSEDYANPLTGSTDTYGYMYKGRTLGTLTYSDTVNEFVVGKITVNYKNAKGDDKTYDKYRFMMSPIENWK